MPKEYTGHIVGDPYRGFAQRVMKLRPSFRQP